MATKDDVEELRGEMLARFKLSSKRTDNKLEKMRSPLDAYTISTDARFDPMESKFNNLTFRLVETIATTIITLGTLYTVVTKILG